MPILRQELLGDGWRQTTIRRADGVTCTISQLPTSRDQQGVPQYDDSVIASALAARRRTPAR